VNATTGANTLNANAAGGANVLNANGLGGSNTISASAADGQNTMTAGLRNTVTAAGAVADANNVVATVNLLDYARIRFPNLDRFVYFSTDEIFGPAPAGVAYREYDRYNSTTPYRASKAAGEDMCVAYENTYKMPIVITHTMNVFGERQHPEKFIPSTIKKVRDGETVVIHADPTRTQAGTRMYIHARDVAEGLMHILTLQDYQHTGDYGGAHCPKFNLVGTEEIDNLSLAQMIAAAQGRELNYEMTDFHSSCPGHDLRYALDGGLLKSLGWEPRIRLSERIDGMVKWTLANPRWLKS
jgi:dTDP-glucose 4,6-dehydratase